MKPCFDMSSKICLVSDPRPQNPYGKLYSVEFLGNVVGGKRTVYNNQGRNSKDILDGLNPPLNPSLDCRPTRRLPKHVLNPCFKLHLNSSLKFQMSIELHPWCCESHP